MKKSLFFLIFTALTLLLGGCKYPPAAHQPPIRPLFGPGSDRQPYSSQQPALAAPSYPPAATPQPPQPAFAAAPWKSRTSSVSTSTGAASWQPLDTPRSQSLGHGATYYEGHARSIAGIATVQAVVFDSRQCTLKVIDQPDPSAGGGAISQLMRAHHAIAGVNGGFFQKDFQPTGMFIAGSRTTGAFSTGGILAGSALVIARAPYLIWNSEYLPEKSITDLIQCGPRLVDGGIPIKTLDRVKQTHRTFIATDGRHTWAIGIVRSTSLAGLADLLAYSNIIPGFHAIRALNLDGGHSTAIWASPTWAREISQPGWSTVRNYLAIIPR